MLTSVVIIACSTALLLYWFRYTCLLILNTRPSTAEARRSGIALWLARAMERGRVEAGASRGALDELSKALERDYRLLTYLLKHTTGLDVGGITIEQRMLMLDFRLMQVWYRLSRALFPPQSRQALQEMCDIVACFAEAVSERNPQAARAVVS
ncbi:MAG: hypothetical protein RMK57_08020 [Bryobacterales bacterium]|nr:hypothetical protein [Bryobacteraceae bacterium]MDW8354461.1 hypothetical protein [Bryobacterales bacterium]